MSDVRAKHAGALKVATVVGARPQFIKAFPLSRALRAIEGIAEIAIHTGQHFDSNMSDIFFSELEMPPPDYQLGIHGGGQGSMTGRMLGAIEDVLIKERPHVVVVYGDTNSTVAAALAASKLHIPVAHVEAGLRSFNKRMPEEINRIVADHLSTLLLCPTTTAITNLSREGINSGVEKTGDLMFDATRIGIEMAARKSSILDTLALASRKYAVATIHRAENTDEPSNLQRVFSYLADLAQGQMIVMPLHPRTKNALATAQIDLTATGIKLIEPVGFLDMCQLLHHASAVYTDSGGVQKEAYFHQVPCVTLRSETEWVETISHGWNRLWNSDEYAPRTTIDEYGDGHAALQIAKSIVRMATNRS